MRIVTASANHELDEILDLIGMVLQLTKTQFDDAEGKYHAVSKWLNAENSPLRQYFPEIYPQGSMRLDTTLRPISFTEFDLDLVCHMRLRGLTPLQVYTLLLDRMRSNGRYRDIIIAKPRCIRLDYAGQFHLDIIPSIQDPNGSPFDTCTWVPDHEKRIWLASNPKGYAVWFERQAAKRILLEEKAARYSANANVEPLRAPMPAYSKPPLKLAVQLFKRWRDVAFKDREQLAPSSIVLTTLSGILYQGEHHPTDALATILDGIHLWSQREDIRLENPSNRGETITDRWEENPEMYQAFLEAVYDFRVTWHQLIEGGRYPDLTDDLQNLFEEAPVNRAIVKFAERRRDASQSGRLLIEKATGILSVPAVASVGPGYIKNKDHTFHGQ